MAPQFRDRADGSEHLRSSPRFQEQGPLPGREKRMLRPSSVRCGYFVGAAISAAGLLSALPGTTKAAVLYSDNFDSYTNGNLSGQGGWTATAAAATPMQVAGTVNKFVAIGTSGQDEYHPLSGTAPHLDGNMLETSFTANVTAA